MNHNVQEVSLLHPAYLGFIFYKGSPRNFDKTIPPLPNTIKKVGVFVIVSKILGLFPILGIL